MTIRSEWRQAAATEGTVALIPEQAKYLNLPQTGPFKPETYRY